MLQRTFRAFSKLRRRGPALGHGRGREGFTLVEILVVLVILSVGVIPIALIQHRAKREVTESDQYTRAVTVGQAQLERIKGMGFGNAVDEAGEDSGVTWNSTITNVGFGLDRIEVTVSWRESGDVVDLTFADLVSMR
ncbi:MAG: prepilin-type N-terminal cleavage/methylation domain-containing protein [bacterium]